MASNRIIAMLHLTYNETALLTFVHNFISLFFIFYLNSFPIWIDFIWPYIFVFILHLTLNFLLLFYEINDFIWKCKKKTNKKNDIHNKIVVRPVSRCRAHNALTKTNVCGIHAKAVVIASICIRRVNMNANVHSDTPEWIVNWNYLRRVYWRHPVILSLPLLFALAHWYVSIFDLNTQIVETPGEKSVCVSHFYISFM